MVVSMQKSVCILASFFLLLSACAGVTKGSHLLAAASFHEECFDLSPDQVLAYSFKSTAAVEFNIHYHEGKSVLSPVSEKDISLLQGTFRPDQTRHYCVMWSNPRSEPVPLDYRLQVKTVQ